jgi:WD40 repeat protein
VLGDPRRAATPTAAPDLQPTFAANPLRDPERYQILGEHGRGGLGRVSRAHDRELGRDVAIKELIARSSSSEDRFLREAMITARLEHPGIVPMYEAGRWPDGTPYYAMKLVAGRPLRDLIVERTTVDQRIGLLHHVIAVADAMAYAHGRNIIHRDLKPANVIIGDFGETIVIDWGLAKDLSAAEDAPVDGNRSKAPHDSDLTTAGAVLGTPAYMAPEQERGERVDQRADVFAIGAMLWELCSLQKVPPTNLRQRHRMLRRAAIDQDLAVIIDKALDPDPGRRYPDAGALASDLKAFKSGARISGRTYSLPAMLTHWTRRHRALTLSAAAAAVIVSAGLVLYVRHVALERAAREIAEARFTESELEQGRAALLHGEPEAQAHLTEAYKREPASATAFMLARSMQPRLAEQARLTSTHGRMWWAAFSPDSTQIATTDDRAAQIWDGRTYKLLFTLPHGCEVYHAVYGTDGTRLVTAARTMVRIWDAGSGELLHDLQRRSARSSADFYRAAVSPDGRFVAAIEVGGSTTHVWNAESGELVAELSNRGAGFPGLAFSPDGWLAITGGDEARVFDVRTWKHVLTIRGSIRSLAFDTRSRLVTGSATGEVALWGIPSGARVRQLRQFGEAADVVAFSPDRKLVAAGSRDGAVQVWQASSGVLQSQLNPRRSKILSVEFDPTSTWLLAANADGTAVVSEVVLGIPVAILDGPQGAVRVAQFDARSRVIGASLDGTARVWDATPPYRRWSSAPAGDVCNIGMGTDQDRRFIAVGCRDRPTRVWDTVRDQLLAELPSASPIDVPGFTSARPVVTSGGDLAAIARGAAVELYELPGGRLLRTVKHSAAVSAVAFADTGHAMVSGALDGSVRVLREDGTELALQASGGVNAAALVSESRVIVSDAERHLHVYSLSGAALADLELPVRMMSLRHDGSRLIAIPNCLGNSAPPRVIDLQRYRATAQLEGHVGCVLSARWTAGGRIVTAGADGTARLWDGATGQLLKVYRGSSRFLADATLLAAGLIVAGDADGLLRFWDAASGAKLWTLPAHKSAVVSVHVEGEDIVTRGFTGEVSRWRLPSSERVIDACGHHTYCAIVPRREITTQSRLVKGNDSDADRR